MCIRGVSEQCQGMSERCQKGVGEASHSMAQRRRCLANRLIIATQASTGVSSSVWRPSHACYYLDQLLLPRSAVSSSGTNICPLASPATLHRRVSIGVSPGRVSWHLSLSETPRPVRSSGTGRRSEEPLQMVFLFRSTLVGLYKCTSVRAIRRPLHVLS